MVVDAGGFEVVRIRRLLRFTRPEVLKHFDPVRPWRHRRSPPRDHWWVQLSIPHQDLSRLHGLGTVPVHL
jgi:hypothetical protein